MTNVFAQVKIPVVLHAATRGPGHSRRPAREISDRPDLRIDNFVPAGTIDFIYVNRPFYVAATATHQGKYTVLRDALARSKRIGIGTMVRRGADASRLSDP
jgi:hypothetical protein